MTPVAPPSEPDWRIARIACGAPHTMRNVASLVRASQFIRRGVCSFSALRRSARPSAHTGSRQTTAPGPRVVVHAPRPSPLRLVSARSLGVRLGDELHDGCGTLPCHGLNEVHDRLDGIQNTPIPVLFEDASAALHGVVLAVVRRVVGEAYVDLMSLSEVHDPREKPRAAALVLRAIVLQQEERVDLRKRSR